MVIRSVANLLSLGAVICVTASLSADERLERRTFDQCFLYRGADGNVWVGHPLVSLGMIGVQANPPVYRLSPALRERFAPLIIELDEAPAEPQFWWWGLPSLDGQDKPLVLVRIVAGAKLRTPEVPMRFGDGPADETRGRSAIYEITAAELVYAEFLSPAWRRAWKSLDNGLAEIVSISRTAPGRKKKERLAEAVERASGALNAMTTEVVTQESRDVVRRIEPRARAVRLFQSDVEGVGIGQWGANLRNCVARLRIEPITPLPKLADDCPLIQLLADSSTAAELLARVRESWPEATLDRRLIHSEDHGGTVFLWQVQHLADAEFEKLRKQSQEQLAREQENKSGEASTSDSASEDVTVRPWNVVLRPADADRLAEVGFLSGTIVERVLPGGSPIGVQRGDMIIDYHSVYDVVMGVHAHFRPANQLARRARYGGKLDLLRGDRLITVEYPAGSEQ